MQSESCKHFKRIHSEKCRPDTYAWQFAFLETTTATSLLCIFTNSQYFILTIHKSIVMEELFCRVPVDDQNEALSFHYYIL
jgi:hypothetical protein